MRKAMLGLTMPLLLLTACEVKVGSDDKNKSAKDGGADVASVTVGADGNVAVAANDRTDGVAISVPGFEGRIKIPGMELGGDDMDIDGMKPYPGSKMRGINVTDQKGPGNALVDMRFTSPAAPDKVAAYYTAAARENDFTAIKLVNDGGKAVLTAKKPDGDDMTITMEPAPGGTAARMLIRDAKDE